MWYLGYHIFWIKMLKMVYSLWLTLKLLSLPRPLEFTDISLSLQVTYAARDAQISVALFLHLLGCPFSRNSPMEASIDHVGWRKVLEKCWDVIDIPFRSKGISSLGEEVSGKTTESQQKPRSKKSKSSGMVPGAHQGRDPRKNKRKPLGVGYSTR